jgi:hypothetical protein
MTVYSKGKTMDMTADNFTKQVFLYTRTDIPEALLTHHSIIHLYDGPRATILVGPQRQEFSLPKNLLEHHSRYFAKTFAGPWTEGTDHTLILDEDDVDLFRMLIQWIYTGRVSLTSGVQKSEKMVPGSLITHYIQFLVLADKLEIFGMEAEVVGKVRELFSGFTSDYDIPCCDRIHVHLAYGLPKNHPMRALIVRASIQNFFRYADKASSTKIWIEGKDYPDFAVDLLDTVHGILSGRKTNAYKIEILDEIYGNKYKI